jgi:hypothetical protein
MSSIAVSFCNLPAELVLDICDFLALDALLALKLTAPRLNSIIRLDPRHWQTSLSTCTQRAIQHHLNSSQLKLDQRHCFLCNATYPIDMFSSSTSPACIPMKLATRPHDVIQLPPNVCCWHVGRLARVVRTGNSGKNEWISHMGKMCMHCGNITDWLKCSCKCDSCGFWTVRTYTRHLNNSKECHRFFFWRHVSEPIASDTGQLWVREACLDDGTSILCSTC